MATDDTAIVEAVLGTLNDPESPTRKPVTRDNLIDVLNKLIRAYTVLAASDLELSQALDRIQAILDEGSENLKGQRDTAVEAQTGCGTHYRAQFETKGRGMMSKTIRALAKARAEVDRLETDIVQVEDNIRQSELGQQCAAFRHRLLLAREEEFALDGQARIEALAEYERTGSKAPFGGAKIKVFKRVGFDAKEALAWSLEHNLCLKLDTTKYKKLAPEMGGPVTVTEEPRAQIDKDLSAYLSE